MDPNTPAPTQEITLESLALQMQEQATHIAVLQQENASLKGKVIEVTATLELPKIPNEPIVINKKKYQWQVAIFTIPGKEPRTLTAEEASLDKDALKAILAIEGQGILKELA